MIKILILFIAFAFGLWMDVKTDFALIQDGKSPEHKSGAALRLLYYFTVTILVVLMPDYGHLLWSIVKILFIMLSAFWIAFEYFLNNMRKLPWNYVGNTAWSDRLLRKWFGNNAGSYLFLFKIFCLTLSIALLVYT